MPRVKVGTRRSQKNPTKKTAQKRTPKPIAASTYLDNRANASKLARLGERFNEIGWGQASEVLREVRAVPTIFPWVDYVLRVGGWPTDRFGLIHGPSNEGKTAFVIGLMLSFLLKDHAAAYIDAERTTPPRWLARLMGSYLQHPGFRALYPGTYEQTVDQVRAFCETLGDAKAKGRIDEDTTGIVVVDSLRKLVPKRLLDKIAKEGASGADDEPANGRRRKTPGGVDGMGGRAAMYKAALNAAWMDELTVLLSQTGTCMVAIGREYEDSDASTGPFASGPDYKLGGGKSLFFESAVVARVTVAEVLREEGTQRVLAEKHALDIRKTKIEAKEVKYPTAYFHSTSAGFDRVRDVLGLGLATGVIEKNGSWFSFDGERLGQGADASESVLRKNAELLVRIEDVLRMKGIPDDALPEQETASSGA